MPVPAGARDDVIGYPVQPAKVQRPPLRDETLARDRLLDWLNVKINHRVVVITAEAGYGKTTLLADFSRRTRHRTLWYRLDEEDRNWVAFLSYLVAAGREHDPEFAPTTFGLLRETGATGPSPDSVIETFVREFQSLGDLGAVLILDDYHVVDDAPDVRQIVGQLLARAPDRVTFVFSTRRRPSIKVARLRGRGEVAELTTDDLRFSEAETERLFRETYQRPLEPDVLDDLSRRTEGWAASLQLVQAALRDRSASQIRSFVRNLSGAEGDLYDYFAEEVVGDLDDRLQDFLMKTSILETVEPELAVVVTGVGIDEVNDHIEVAEKLGLLSRRSDGSKLIKRFHPLVGQFLQDRLARRLGDEQVRELHERIADEANASGDWRMACTHLDAIGDEERLGRVLAGAVHQIMGTGQYVIANIFLERHPAIASHPAFDIIRSRIAYRQGVISDAIQLATRALDADSGSGDALMNLMSLHFQAYDADAAYPYAQKLATSASDPVQRAIGGVMAGITDASTDGDLPGPAAAFLALADRMAGLGHRHFEGIALTNAAELLRAIGDARQVVTITSRALELLEASAVHSEAATAHALRTWGLAHLNEWDRAATDLASIEPISAPFLRAEFQVMTAITHTWYGDARDADLLLAESRSNAWDLPDLQGYWVLASAAVSLRHGDVELARQWLGDVPLPTRCAIPASHLLRQTLQAWAAVAAGSTEAAVKTQAAIDLARRQRSDFYSALTALLAAGAGTPSEWDAAVGAALGTRPVYVSILASLAAPRLHVLSDGSLASLTTEAAARPKAWRDSLRRVVDDPAQPSRIRAARLLESIGTAEDIRRLRALAKTVRGDPDLGRNLARTLAPRVTVEDLGRILIQVGDRHINGTSVRRKVLASLVFLASRPNFSATRDQVLDALWPDLSPEIAVNSLNQTIYFLRRVFEPTYKEELSPEYVHHDSDVIWLDQDLVRSRSATCWSLVARMTSPANPKDVEVLSEAYSGRFALDFAYEEWAVAYRDALHAAYLQVIENAVALDTLTGHFDRGARTARRALEIDPEAEQVELSLLRLYRRSGAHAAAAEQYAHYASMLRLDLGIEPPPLESL